MGIPILGANSASGAYEISNSLRFNDNDSAYLSRTPSSAGNRRTFTYSGWVKPAVASATSRTLIGAGANSGTNDYSIFQSGNKLRFSFATEGSGDIVTDGVFRDPAAWYHIVWAIDTTQSTASNRVKLYINGTQETNVSGTYPAQDYQTSINNTVANVVGARSYSTTSYYDGYMAEVYLVDGQALDPTYFGETNDNGVWVPVENGKGAGGAINFGTNGFYLQFKQTGTSADASGMGADTSGNTNHFTPSNLAALDVTEDTPTNNFATLNPLIGNSGITYSEGNLQFSQYYNTASTIAVANGKWYLEMKILNDNTYNPNIGIAQTHTTLATIDVNDYHGNVTDSYGISREGNLFANGSNIGSQGFTLAQNDIVGVALDLDSGTKTIKWYKNGSQVATRNLSETQSNPYVFGTYASSSQAGEGSFNFGNPAFSISSGNSDANGYGNFEYSVPSGYYALCTKNLAQFG